MENIIQIKCSFCGAILSVRNQQGIEAKNVTCPVCKNKSPFTSYRRVAATTNENADRPPVAEKESDTELPQINFILGRLIVTESGDTYQLKVGKNIVGRKSKNSQSDFQIDTGENRAMSRSHIVIDVKKVEYRGFIHSISLYKENVNATFIGDEPLLPGDSVILNDGDIIKLPGTILRFEIPDEEATQI